MDPGQRGGAPAVTSARTEVRLTPALVVLVVVLGVVAGLRPSVASPTLTAVIWSGLVATVSVGVLWPVLGRRWATLEVTGIARDATEGEPFPIEFTLAGGGFPLQVELPEQLGHLTSGRGDVVSGMPGGASLPAGGDQPLDATAVLQRRGVHRRLALRVVDSGPFGLLRVSRAVTVVLPSPLHVAPRAVPEPPGAGLDRSGSTEPGRSRAASAGDTVRSVRPYVPGDPAHLVHWPSSAHAGELMVMELEPPSEPLVAIVVDLRGGAGEPLEHAVRRAAGAAQRALGAGQRVLLGTATPDGPRISEVRTPRQLGRRLAEAVPGPPAEPPEGIEAMVFTPGDPSTTAARPRGVR